MAPYLMIVNYQTIVSHMNKTKVRIFKKYLNLSVMKIDINLVTKISEKKIKSF